MKYLILYVCIYIILQKRGSTKTNENIHDEQGTRRNEIERLMLVFYSSCILQINSWLVFEFRISKDILPEFNSYIYNEFQVRRVDRRIHSSQIASSALASSYIKMTVSLSLIDWLDCLRLAPLC